MVFRFPCPLAAQCMRIPAPSPRLPRQGLRPGATDPMYTTLVVVRESHYVTTRFQRFQHCKASPKLPVLPLVHANKQSIRYSTAMCKARYSKNITPKVY